MNDRPQPELSETGDGSHTLYSSRFSQHYHNRGGALAESRHVFFEKSGLLTRLEQSRESLIIHETGFGTGLNLMLLMEAVRKTGFEAPVTYCSVEGWPLTPEMAEKLNYAERLDTGEKDLPARFFRALSPGMNRMDLLGGQLSLCLFKGLFRDFDPGEVPADYFFHDPFSPDANPELWTGEVFRTLLRRAAPRAVLSTYSAASRARGALSWAGWNVARAPGALGKREMTVASPHPEPLEPFERVNERHLAERYESGDFG